MQILPIPIPVIILFRASRPQITTIPHMSRRGRFPYAFDLVRFNGKISPLRSYFYNPNHLIVDPSPFDFAHRNFGRRQAKIQTPHAASVIVCHHPLYCRRFPSPTLELVVVTVRGEVLISLLPASPCPHPLDFALLSYIPQCA